MSSNASVHRASAEPLPANSMSQRTQRVDELLRQEIGSILARDVADPRIGFATVTSVETTPDLRHAKVWVSVIGQPAERDATLSALRGATPFVRHELGSRLRIRRIPDLHIQFDDTAERGTRVLRLLSELESGTIPEGEAPVGESLPTPLPRLPRAGDLPEEPPSAVRPPDPDARRRRAGRQARGRSVSGPRGDRRTSR
jgi:ribosome-binding factor A